jgi:catechol 2,3-dioxygenase-like lactoylglutathione lyase family enzyme
VSALIRPAGSRDAAADRRPGTRSLVSAMLAGTARPDTAASFVGWVTSELATRKAGPDMTGWEKRIGAITLFVEDVAASREFYQRVFDLSPFDDGPANVGFRLTGLYFFLTLSANATDMIAPLTAGAAGTGPRHVFAIIVDDVDAVAAELTGKGVPFVNGPEDRSWGMRTLNFADPDGYIWEIAQAIGG